MHHVIEGDSAVSLRRFEDDSIDAIITDPPHAIGSGFMSADWDRERPEQVIWNECLRVLKPGGHCWVMSSERIDCVAGFYLSLKEAGFEVDNHQLIGWLTLTGMPKSSDVAKTADKEAFRAWLAMHRETVTCPNHKEPIDPVTKEKQRCVECERIFVEGKLTRHDKRKAESAAVNGDYVKPGRHQKSDWHTGPSKSRYGIHTDHTEDNSLLTRLLALHWPTSPAEQRAQWEACVAEVPEEWDCSRPPGVRVSQGLSHWGLERGKPGQERVYDRSSTWANDAPQATAPSTPDACALEGRRASVAPLKPFCYPIIHAQKPCEGSYLANWRKWGTGPVGVGDARIPFGEDGAWAYPNGPGGSEGHHMQRGEPRGLGDKPTTADPAGRTPSNLLSYSDLLGDLQRYADLSAWCEALGLPEAAAELLEAGLVYAPKPSQREKCAGLDAFEEKPREVQVQQSAGRQLAGQNVTMPTRNPHPTCKPTALCAYLVTLATAPGQTVLDPFCGSGSTGVACALIGRRFIGIELSEDFAAIARARIAHAASAVDDTSPQVSAQPTVMEVAAK